MTSTPDQHLIEAILSVSRDGVVKIDLLPAEVKRLPRDERWRLFEAAGVVPASVDSIARFLDEGLTFLTTGIPTSAIASQEQRKRVKRARKTTRGGFAEIRRQQHVMRLAAFLELLVREPELTTSELAQRAGTTTRTIQLWIKQLGLGGIKCPIERSKAARARSQLSLSIRIGRS